MKPNPLYRKKITKPNQQRINSASWNNHNGLKIHNNKVATNLNTVNILKIQPPG